MDERFRVGNILEDTATRERFEVIEVTGRITPYVSLLSLENGLRYGNFANNLDGLVLVLVF